MTSSITLRLSDAVPGIRSLGVGDALELLRSDGEVLLHGEKSVGRRAQVLANSPISHGSPGRYELRYPLPGTPDENGRVHEPPRGAGTGWVRLIRFGSSPPSSTMGELTGDGGKPWQSGRWKVLGSTWKSRLSAPHSRSRAAREWNLFCLLAQAGVATPELLAMGELGQGAVASQSFLVLREFENWPSLPDWLASRPSAEGLRLGADAVGRCLGALLRSPVELAGFLPDQLRLSPLEQDPLEADHPDDCDREPAFASDQRLGLRRSMAAGIDGVALGRQVPQATSGPTAQHSQQLEQWWSDFLVRHGGLLADLGEQRGHSPFELAWRVSRAALGSYAAKPGAWRIRARGLST